MYVAFYENAAKVEKAAVASGFTGNDGESWHDFVEAEANKFREQQQFTDLDKAVDWLKAEISANKSVYGCGTVQTIELTERRCRYCICHGNQVVHEYTVDDTGITDDRPMESMCSEE